MALQNRNLTRLIACRADFAGVAALVLGAGDALG